MPDAQPYSHLAPGYDAVMAHVDYPGWAEHVARLLDRSTPGAREVVEIGCGTGALTLALDRIADFRLRGYDGAPEMIAEAERSAARAGADVAFGVLSFHESIPGPPADAIVLVYDGLNYLLAGAEVVRLLRRVHDALVPGGVFVVDQSTPQNSLNHIGAFDDEGETEAFSYVRMGRYSPETALHTTTFDLRYPSGAHAREVHVQRAYTRDEMAALIADSPLEAVSATDAFSLDPATDASERIHWVLQRPG
ncbi:MAG: class I SAM-dependent methyltransferase [Bacteroidota bacterium]